MTRRPRPAGPAGFSLIEVLVATTILLVIVVFVSMVFQQQSGAFQAGVDRAKGQSALRNVLGMLSRDLSLAVDAADYPGLPPNRFGASSMEFLAMTGTPGKNIKGESDPDALPLQRIEYETAGGIVRRKVSDVKFANGKWGTGLSVSVQVNGIRNPLQAVAFSFIPNGASPAAVKITASCQADKRASMVSGHSLGKDREAGTKDDIFAGGKFNE